MFPVIFISGYGRDEIIAEAFEMGAADYVVKPFSPTELLARIKAALRKRSAPPLEERTQPFEQGELRIHYPERHVYLGAQQLTLTASEFAVLAELSTQAGRVVSHDYLLRRIWGVSVGGDARLVRAVVKRLRRKLDDDANDPTFIFTEPRGGLPGCLRLRLTPSVADEQRVAEHPPPLKVNEPAARRGGGGGGPVPVRGGWNAIERRPIRLVTASGREGVDHQAGRELGYEIGALLRHEAAGFGGVDDVLQGRGGKDEPALASPPLTDASRSSMSCV